MRVNTWLELFVRTAGTIFGKVRYSKEASKAASDFGNMFYRHLPDLQYLFSAMDWIRPSRSGGL